jgi:hypothetical protein
MLNLVGAHYHNVIFYENYIVSNIYWLLTLTMFKSVALLPSSDSRSCTVGMADFNCWLVRPPRLQQKVCFFLHWDRGDRYKIMCSLVCYTAMNCLNSFCAIPTLQICIKQVVWSSGIQWNFVWPTCIMIDTISRHVPLCSFLLNFDRSDRSGTFSCD